MSAFWITNTRQDGIDADRRVDAVMVNNQVYPIDQIINWIETGVHTFWVKVKDRQVPVFVRQHLFGHRKYLTTQADSFSPNNLLNLPPC